MICTECGQDFLSEDEEEEICPECQQDELPPEARLDQFVACEEDRPIPVDVRYRREEPLLNPDKAIFTHCNVCGCPLRKEEEDLMGMCVKCAAGVTQRRRDEGGEG